ncbi:tyrosine--tRNA ligase [Neomegalonema sp.]|uniref:tyrosine--tRNA ligase n=1 Tax=Neomegalonema sp. TaxID=2039713 RepID=UPI002627EBD5|nr:tyrosine--tRNA ligase [Neomegalonema sp.]MDD2867906.1 tyrosine--tRNA ligase [Neomegalonema sp.]
MSRFKSEFLAELSARGFIQDCSDYEGLDALLKSQIVPGYIGFDATATSLHVGGLMQIMMLRWLQKTGHKPVVLMGGGTTRVGDPTGRDEARPLLTPEKIEENKAGIRKVFVKYLTFGEGPTDALMIDNAEWLDRINYLDFLRDYGRHFSINRMLAMDSVKLRLEREQAFSFLEFNYMLLQSYDFVEINRRYGVRLQMGGSDQWGNIVTGVDLGRRMGTPDLYALISPLLTMSDGRKMGKSLGGAVWINADMLSPYEFWQFWRNIPDADVERFLKLYTELPLDEIARLGALGGSEINEAKKILADEATTLAHGREAAEAAKATAQATFEAGELGADLPAVTLNAEEAAAGVSLVQLFQRAGLASSGKEARRLFSEGGARVNDQPASDPTRLIGAADLAAGPLKLSAGKKRHAVVTL